MNYFALKDAPSPKNIEINSAAPWVARFVRTTLFSLRDYEGHRIRQGITRTANVPAALERAGDFSQSGGRLVPIDLFTQQPFPNFVIPRNRIDPIGSAIAALYPLPNRSVIGQSFVASPTETDRDDHFDVRVDHNLAPSYRF